MKNIPKTMHAVLLTGHGGLEKLEYKTDIPVPVPKDDEVLIKVAAAGPISNLILCFSGIFIFHIVRPPTSDTLYLFLQIFISINAALAVFNLLPVYPLDGGQIFGNFISKYNRNIFKQLNDYGPKVLFGVILFSFITDIPLIGYLIHTPAQKILYLFQYVIVQFFLILNNLLPFINV